MLRSSGLRGLASQLRNEGTATPYDWRGTMRTGHTGCPLGGGLHDVTITASPHSARSEKKRRLACFW